jgi:hypothetical protein
MCRSEQAPARVSRIPRSLRRADRGRLQRAPLRSACERSQSHLRDSSRRKSSTHGRGRESFFSPEPWCKRSDQHPQRQGDFSSWAFVPGREKEKPPRAQICPRGELNRLCAVSLAALTEELGFRIQRVGSKLADALVDPLKAGWGDLCSPSSLLAVLAARLARGTERSVSGRYPHSSGPLFAAGNVAIASRRVVLLASPHARRPVANGGTKSRLWWMRAAGLARKPLRLHNTPFRLSHLAQVPQEGSSEFSALRSTDWSSTCMPS